jgi:hypothetical protein
MAMTLRLDPKVDAQLTELASRLGMSKQQALSLAVAEFIAEHDSSSIARRVMDEVLIRDKELLDWPMRDQISRC